MKLGKGISIAFGLSVWPMVPSFAAPIGPSPGGSITFQSAVSALPVPVNTTLGLIVLAVAMVAVAALVMRRTQHGARMFAIGLPVVGVGLLFALVLAPDMLTARPADTPGSFDVSGPGTIDFEFPASENVSGVFDPVAFWNRSGQPLLISDLTKECGLDDFPFQPQEQPRGAELCEEGGELAVDEVCVVEVPDCREIGL